MSVKCKNGHLFNNTYHNRCPICGASIDEPRWVAPAQHPLAGSPHKENVCGWIVCIDGIDKGQDFELVGNSTIGCGLCSVSLSDQRISRVGFEAEITYDDRHGNFFLVKGSKGNLPVYHNDKPLLKADPLQPYDLIEIGGNKLVFVPLCGETFHW